MTKTIRPRSAILLRTFASRAAEVDAFCREAKEALMAAGLSSEVFPVELLLRESLNNAMIHGNRGDEKKSIRAEFRIGRKWLVLRVADEGAGFGYRKNRREPPDPEATGGRGLVIYGLYADRVSFNIQGNQVSLWRAMTGVKGCESARNQG